MILDMKEDSLFTGVHHGKGLRGEGLGWETGTLEVQEAMEDCRHVDLDGLLLGSLCDEHVMICLDD